MIGGLDEIFRDLVQRQVVGLEYWIGCKTEEECDNETHESEG